MKPSGDERSQEKAAIVPEWVKATLIAAGLFGLLIVVLLLTGHGPGQHGAERQGQDGDPASMSSPAVPAEHAPFQGGER